MLRFSGLIFIIFLFSFKGGDKSLKGSWSAVYEEMNGKVLPTDFFQNQVLTLKRKKYKLVAESVDEGRIEIFGEKMDIFGAGKHIRAIFKIEDDQLIICYDLGGRFYPVSFSTKDQPDYFLARFKRIEAK